MPITLTCTCGKRFRTADVNAGKKTRCPGCGATISIPAAAPTPARTDDIFSLAEPETFAPAPAVAAAKSAAPATKSLAAMAPPLSKRDRNTGPSRVPAISISPGIIALILAAIFIPAALFWVKEGPMKAQKQWTAMAQTAQDNINGLIVRAIGYQYTQMGINLTDPDNVHPHPKVTAFFFDEPILMWSLPESMTFQGHTNEGFLRGTFHPHTLRFEADVEIERAVHRVTGSVDPEKNTFDYDGQPAPRGT